MDPTRLEDGLRQLRELGYLHNPAEERLARSVGSHRRRAVQALAAGAWIGSTGAATLTVLLTVSAVLAEPSLLDRPRSLAFLSVDLLLVLGLLSVIGTTLLASSLLSRKESRGRRVEALLVHLPVVLVALYLADRLGRQGLAGIEGVTWWISAAVASITAGLVGAVAAVGLRIALQVARATAETRTRLDLRPAGRFARARTVVLGTLLGLALLVLGPYRELRPLPPLDTVEIAPRGPLRDFVLLAIDGVSAPSDLGADWRLVEGDPIPAGLHPVAYWNELVTGFAAPEHGVLGAAEARPRGVVGGVGEARRDPVLALVLRHLLPGAGLTRETATGSHELRRPPIWEIVAHAGGRATAVNWWATYPAARHRGLSVLTERALLRGFFGEHAEDASLASGESSSWLGVDVAQVTEPLASDIAAVRAEARALCGGDSTLSGAFELAIVGDAFHFLAAGLDARGGGQRFLLLNGADILVRAFERGHAGTDPREGRLRALHWEFVRGLLERARVNAGEDLVVVGVGAPTDDGSRATWSAATGSPTPPRGPATAATWLVRIGIPPALDMPVSGEEASSWEPSERPRTFGRRGRWSTESEGRGGDLERLRSLGYIGG